MLKITVAEEEKLPPELMIWWNGEGAAHVLAHDGYALLLERTNGSISLAELARTGHDDEASRIICSVVLQPRDIRVLHGDIHHFTIINPCHLPTAGGMQLQGRPQTGRAQCRA